MAPDTAHATQHNKPSGHTGEEEPSGPGHRTHNTMHGASTPVNRSKVALDTAHAKQRTRFLVCSHLCLFLVLALKNLDDFPQVEMSHTQR